jgi:glycosyltransferase involved in cell wall biosynthesis
MARPKISVLVTTKNEAPVVEACVRSLDWADEVLLIDSFSTDGTVEIVREKFPKVRVIQREYLGAAAQKNFGIDELLNDWVLVVDCDEQVTPALRDEILRVLEDGPNFWAYWIGRANFILGKPVRYSGLQHDGVRRLFHRKHARYPNRRVHVDLAVDGPVGKLVNRFDHLYVRSFDHMAEKMTRYGLWGAAQLHLDGRRVSGFGIWVHATYRFIRDYILNFGFLDGAPGLITVGFHTYYTFWKYAKLWEFNRLKEQGRPVPLPPIETDAEIWKMPWEEKAGPQAAS